LTALKILTVSSEAGGARNLIEVVEQFRSEIMFTNLCAGGAIGAFEESSLTYRNIDGLYDTDELSGVVRSLTPDAVLSGRGVQLGSPERMAVEVARKLQIPSVGLIDEWYDYKKNYVNKTGVFNALPDMVCCPDEQARVEALRDGLPEDRLCVTGSPLFASVFSNRNVTSHRKPEEHEFLAAQGDRLLVVFLSEVIESEPIEQMKKSIREEEEFDSPGYDEYGVRRMLCECLEALALSCIVVEKIHPSARKEDYPILNTRTVDWYTVRDIDRSYLFDQADLVVGMRSAALLEARILGVPVVSLQPGLVGPNRCTAARKKLIPLFSSVDSFCDWLKSQSFPYKNDLTTRPEFARKEAASNVISVVQKLTTKH
jgi:hypothetical protein